MADNKRGNADRSLPKPPPRQQNDGFSSSQLHIRREWWIYPTTVSLEEYNRKAQDHEPDDSFFSNFVCFVLAHDIVGFVEESSKETGIEADVLLALVLKNSPVVCPEKHEMPIERFIELYNSYVALCDLSNCNANRYRSDMKSMAIQVLRKKWPK